jgi:carbon-monoxide dehydrogenase small subunit
MSRVGERPAGAPVAVEIAITLSVNGREVAVSVAPETTLLDLLRDTIGLAGTKRGCEIGECGACTVLLDGRAVNACLVLAAQADGARVRTVEDLAPADGLSPLQEAFLDRDAVQCGFCTPGLLMSATELLAVNPDPTDMEIRTAISGNLCRCTGYQAIVEAIREAARRKREAP